MVRVVWVIIKQQDVAKLKTVPVDLKNCMI